LTTVVGETTTTGSDNDSALSPPLLSSMTNLDDADAAVVETPTKDVNDTSADANATGVTTKGTEGGGSGQEDHVDSTAPDDSAGSVVVATTESNAVARKSTDALIQAAKKDSGDYSNGSSDATAIAVNVGTAAHTPVGSEQLGPTCCYCLCSASLVLIVALRYAPNGHPACLTGL
jgi:hypothetical protein